MKSALVIFLSSIHVVSASENTAGCLLRDGNVAEKVGRYRSQLVEFFFNTEKKAKIKESADTVKATETLEAEERHTASLSHASW